MRMWRTRRAARALMFLMAMSLAWLQVGPVWAGTVRQNAANRQEARLRLDAARRASGLAPGLTQTPDAALRRKIEAKKRAAVKPVADVRPLTSQEMARARGRGPFRNPYYSGTLPWQRSLRDVNLCNGNLFKSFTDIQVAPARGAGLVLQRTYNSNDARIGPFGVGWTHAYDIRIQEAADVQAESGNPKAVSVQLVSGAASANGTAQAGGADTINEVPRTDFFGAKHTYHRDADGLYSPPPYLYDEMSSGYDKALVNGPSKVDDDTEKGMDGTVKHYASVLTLADGSPGNERACDSITDRYGNQTVLTYGLSFVQADGSTRKLLTKVTDPTGRALTFHWTNFGTSAQPAYRITETDAPTDPGTGQPAYRVTYGYYTDSGDAASYLNLHTVTLDPDGLNRTTTYTYTSYTGLYPDQNGQTQTGTENGLLANVTDPLGHTVSYHYSTAGDGYSPAWFNNTESTDLWVDHITEPGGVDASGNPRQHTWTIYYADAGYVASEIPVYSSEGTPGSVSFSITHDEYGRVNEVDPRDEIVSDTENDIYYDNTNNVVARHEVAESWAWTNVYYQRAEVYTYGQHGNVLTHGIVKHTDYGYSENGGIPPYTNPTCYGQDTTAYYNASQYFQKQSVTDMDGHVTTMGIGADTAGTSGDPDTNIGDRGQTLWVQDAGYNDSVSPSYHKQYTYTYNQYGQKTSETNLNGGVTTYTYGTSGTDLGNLTQVVQDPGGAGHLNRTTTMHYDTMSRVLSSTDPSGLTSTFTYNSLGQPMTVTTPTRGSVAGETVSYVYDGNGRTHSVTDARGTTTMAYEAGCDRVHSVTDPVTGTTSYTYNVFGARTSLTLPGGGTWTYNYQTYAVSQTGAFAYGEYAQLPGDDPEKMTINLGSITDDQGRTVEFNTLPDGRLVSMRSNETYDASGSLVAYLQTDYTYDLPARQPGDSGSIYTHGWLSGLTTTWHYQDTSGGYPQRHARFVSSNAYAYDNLGQRLSNTVTTAVPNADGTPQYSGGTTATYDSSGNVTNQVTSSRTESYTYDGLSRLTGVDYGDGESQSYTFDAMGNRLTRGDTTTGAGGGTTSTAYTVDAANRLLTAGSSAYTSDADGNTLTDGTRTNAWDGQNRLVQSIVSGTTCAYTYGADGLRRSSTVTPSGGSATTTDYAYDGQSLAREMQTVGGSLAPTATYFNGPRGPEYRRDDTQAEGTYTDATGTHTAGKARWYVYDGLGSVVGEVDPSGNLTTTGKYDVYGAKRGSTGAATSRQGFVGSLGHVTDSETGLIYMRARYYDPGTGRFISQDPSCNGSNWFVYTDDSPTNRADADGHASTWITILAEVGLEVLKNIIYGADPTGTLGGPGVDPIQDLVDMRQEILDTLKHSATKAGGDAGDLEDAEGNEHASGGVDAADEIATGEGLIGDAQNVADSVEKLSVLDEIEGEGWDDGFDGPASLNY